MPGKHVGTLLACASILTATGHAATITETVFATGAVVNGTAPDSVTAANGSIWVSYTNGADSTGLKGHSTVVQYDIAGNVLHQYTIAGYVDGLKVNPADGKIWAMQNQDGNSTLTIIDPATNTAGPAMQYAVKSSTRGYDDVVFHNGSIFMSYTNPVSGVDATIQRLKNGSNPIAVDSTILTMGAVGTDLADGRQEPTAQNDPDSLKSTPGGGLMLSSGDDGQLIFVNGLGGLNAVSFLQLRNPKTGKPVSGLDDAIFVTATAGTFYLSDTGHNRVLAIHATGLTPGSLYASIGSLNEFASVNQTTGFVSSFAGSVKGPHGVAFVANTPEPGASAGALIGLAFLALLARRRRDRAR
jgi:hypothetical protein